MPSPPTRPDLTSRQFEILFTLMQGVSNRDIAAHLHVSEQTVKNQLTIMYEKMGVHNRLQLALEGLRFVADARAPVPHPPPRATPNR
jgi:DNA-binding NarL/FixJ family response regulator